MRRKVLARAVHHKRSIAYLGRSTPSAFPATEKAEQERRRLLDMTRRLFSETDLRAYLLHK